MYLDISDQNKKLMDIVWKIHSLLTIMAAFFILVILFIYKRAIRHHQQCLRLEKKLKDSAMTDELTGLLNRGIHGHGRTTAQGQLQA